MKKRSRATIKDVAKLAGVSKATVSKVLNNTAKISEQVRKQVQEAAEKLVYRPSQIARSLKNKTTKSIGLVLPSVTDPFFTEVIRGVHSVATEKGYMVILCDSEEDIRTEFSYIQILEDIWVDGIVFSGIRGGKDEDEKIRILYDKGVPTVLVDRETEDYFTNAVIIDDKEAAFKATRYCLEMGHRKIGFIAAPLDVKIFSKRLEGYKEALQTFGLDVDENLIQQGDLSPRSGRMAAKRLLNCKKRPTTIFASTDMMAVGALKEIQESGLNVPKDISLIGFDDIPLVSLVTPSLTTVHAPSHEMGVEATRLLIRQIEGESVSRTKLILETKLMIRESVVRIS